MARSKAAKRDINPISMSFLDVMSVGFGAVVLIFLILDHNLSTQTNTPNPELSAEIDLLDEDIREGKEGLVRIRNTLSDVDLQIVQAQGRARSIQEEVDTFLEELAQLENTTLAREESVEKLKSDIQTLEQEVERLKAQEQQSGEKVRQFIGEGNRQYLTGLLMGGNRILILVDTSASMLDNTIVNIIRRRNMPDEAKIEAEKWMQAKETVDWLTANLPPPSRYQIYLFNDETRAAVPGTEGQWLEVADQEQLNQAVANLAREVPDKGTNMERAFEAIAGLNPLPDNVYLITDGLPTLGAGAPRGNTISGRDRERVFGRSLRALPPGIPINTILLSLEGDPNAGGSFWRLAVATGGSFLTPSSDWP